MQIVEVVRRSRRVDFILLIGSLVNEDSGLHQAGLLAPLAAETPIFFLSYTPASPRVLAGFGPLGPHRLVRGGPALEAG